MGNKTCIGLNDLDHFINSSETVLILVDAKWNNYKDLAKRFYGIKGCVLGEIDADNLDLTDKLKEWKVSNIPAVVYFQNGKHTKTVIGNNQEINL